MLSSRNLDGRITSGRLVLSASKVFVIVLRPFSPVWGSGGTVFFYHLASAWRGSFNLHVLGRYGLTVHGNKDYEGDFKCESCTEGRLCQAAQATGFCYVHSHSSSETRNVARIGVARSCPSIA